MTGHAGTAPDDAVAGVWETGGGARSGARARIIGIDLARALAIVGMLAVHVGSSSFATWGWVYALPWGRASVLFCLLAGVGVTMLAAARSGTIGYARWRLAWRALVLLPLGLLLQRFDHGFNVILHHYAALFIVGIVTIGLPDRWLLSLAGAFGLLGPLGFLAGQIWAPTVFARSAASMGDPIGEVVHKLILSGPYPVITWAAPFLLGMWLGRFDLRALAVRCRLIVVGGGGAIAAYLLSKGLQALFGTPSGPIGWSYVMTNAPHSQMPLWLIEATGSAAFIFGGSLLLGDILRRWAWPLVATGQLSLTVYVGHLLALSWWRKFLTPTDGVEAAKIVLNMTIYAGFFAMAWRAARPRGPLEAVLHMLPRRRHMEGTTGTASVSAIR